MKVLIITRKGSIQQVFHNEEEFPLAVKAEEELEGGALFWSRFSGGEVGANSRKDDEKTYLIRSSEGVS